MIGIVTSDLTCRLTGEKTYRREVGYCTTANGTDINRAIIARVLPSRARATMTAMCLSSRRPRWRRNHVRPIA